MSTPTSTADRPGSRTPVLLARLGLVLALLGALAALAAGLLYRMQSVPLGTAFTTLRWATYGAMAAIVAALIALVWLSVIHAPRGRVMAVSGCVLGVLVAAPPLTMYDQAQQLPKIHDISTDTSDPPAFVDVLPMRTGAKNPVDYKPETAAEQKRGYPDIAPLRLDVPPVEAFNRAEHAARAMGWQIVSVSPAALRIEATDTTLLFGFKDDVVIRVRPQGTGSVLDVRSLSRIGGSDIGTNAKRVRRFLKEVTG
jgi:uncharacterized protein (DUF1499 family)